MSNLIPEKRVDKNGVLTTKHVRASAPATPTRELPAPALTKASKRKPPTGTQLKQYPRTFPSGLAAGADSRLLELLDLERYVAPKYLSFTTSDVEIYDVLSVTNSSNAIALLYSGITSSAEAIEYLKKHNMENVLHSRECVAEALNRRITPEAFIRAGDVTDSDVAANPLLMDSIETSSLQALEGHYQSEVASGKIRLSDIKAIGAVKIKMASSWDAVGEALLKLGSGEANYTVYDVKFVLDHYMPITRQITEALAIADYYGKGFIQELEGVNAHAFDYFPDLKEAEPDRERSAKIYLYIVSVFRLGSKYGDGSMSTKEAVNDLIRFHDEGIEPEDVATGTITIKQLEAIVDHGVNPSVSKGWL